MVSGLLLATVLARTAPICTPFSWRAISLGDHTAERAAVILPVSIDGVLGTVPMQLDTGSGSTLLYGQAGASRRRHHVAVDGWPY